jgi:hypothetical protein
VLQPAHPIAYGYEEVTSIFRGNGPLWEVGKRDRGRIVLQFGSPRPEWLGSEETGGETAADAADGAPEIEEEELPVDAPPVAVEEVEVGAAAVEIEAEEGAEAKEEAAGEPVEKGDDGELVLSGFVQGEETVAGKPAILDLPVGQGRVILFAFNPLHRYLNLSDFRFLWNVLLHWNDLPGERQTEPPPAPAVSPAAEPPALPPPGSVASPAMTPAAGR